MTTQGHPRTVFRRAIERGNYLIAITTAREVGRLDLAEAVELSNLIAVHEPARAAAAAGRSSRSWTGSDASSARTPGSARSRRGWDMTPLPPEFAALGPSLVRRGRRAREGAAGAG